jgi:hypothetical protein
MFSGLALAIGLSRLVLDLLSGHGFDSFMIWMFMGILASWVGSVLKRQEDRMKKIEEQQKEFATQH